MPSAAQFPATIQLLQNGIQERLHLGGQVYISVGGRTRAHISVGENLPGTPLTADTVMLWFSSGKPITVLALAQLYDLGRLDWDDPVANHVTEFGRAGKATVTVRHLLTHTGGFRTADPVPYHGTWEEAVEHVCASPLEPDWVPGEKAGYHYTSSWFILAEIVQRLSGVPFARYVQEQIFEPLGMNDCWMALPPDKYRAYGTRLGRMYQLQNNELQPHEYWNSEEGSAHMRPGGNVRGPIRDLGLFYEAILSQLARQNSLAASSPFEIRRATLETLLAPQRVGMFDHTFQHIIDFGLGFITNSNQYGCETVPYGYGRYASESAVGHSGAQSSCAFVDPQRELVVAWICNGMPGERRHQRRARELNSAIYADLGWGGRL